jgi:hypothetical protein
MGIPEYEAKRYEGRVKHGGILLSVHCDNHEWAKRGEEILKRTGAEDIASTHEASADYATSDKPMLRTRSTIVEERTERVEPINLVQDRNPNQPVVAVIEPEDDPTFRTTGGGRVGL